ncbi:bacillithiol transferase BstA [Paenibacillus sp. P96]|uniref:Putative metal-dependent hydrolase OIN60_01220 n=1 Tax=Paenibacillus zeirhizosphaerae TaxID=2987519 RepID=A0ABT9FM06_9BACL|nr:bacillithiol transferase BstA [Paenibacillus sp. P96]MDP4095412.1 bacillithiol transferase BstA [Paenibacillus sp. P96]
MSVEWRERYPIGEFEAPDPIPDEMLQGWINDIAELPAKLRAAVKGLDDEQLDTPYREGGWTVRQVVHHVADSHINSYVRFKLALTEELPAIKPYEEGRWAELPDARLSVEVSLNLLDSLHERWVTLLRSFEPEQFSRSFVHPESGVISLKNATGMYSWHGMHHTAHITSLTKRMGW